MRSSILASLALLAASQCARAASLGYGRRQDIACPPVDDDGTDLTDSTHDDDFVTCTYEGAGACTYSTADGSLSSGLSQCPQGIVQDPSATTNSPSSANSVPTNSSGDDSTSEADTSTDIDSDSAGLSTPGLSTPRPIC
ncbi:hypothetical protein MVEN_00483200 [Mycena venus]|uniref:Uncharacterized protein n=1 Tax=Mycena venus TaxID=2733690 RepID=A0A8H7D9A4_9AGAR|nr:hypothetical protein MVEN_00483200 [Mycena venus]